MYWFEEPWDRRQLRRALIEDVAELLRGPASLSWTMSYAVGDGTSALERMRMPAVARMRALIAHRAAHPERAERPSSDRFIPDICAGRYGVGKEGETMVNSVHGFLPLADEYGIGVSRLHLFVRGLPHNRRGIVSSLTKERRQASENMLRFLAHSYIHHDNGFGTMPRGVAIDRLGQNLPVIADERLRAMLAAATAEGAARIIQMYCDEEEPVERVETRMAHTAALSGGAL